jgi:hypothetical protein
MNIQVIETLKVLSDFFTHEGIVYHVTGGLAGNIYGSNWKLSDIDLEVHLSDLSRVEKCFSAHVKRPIARYVDDEFDIWLLQLCLNGIVIDINAVEDFYVFTNGERIKIETTFNSSMLLEYHDLKLSVQSLEEIIAYKRILNRRADVDDLSTLLKRV